MTQENTSSQVNAAPTHAYRVICFDLDGTLLPMDMDEFLERYYRALDELMAEVGADVEQFNTALHAGIRAMASHEVGQSNAEAFWSHFFAIADKEERDWVALLTEFYQNRFNAIGQDVTANPDAAEAIRVLREKGYPLVLATMPMFPREAVEWRLAWAGIDPAQFERITTYDNSTAVKPQSFYYAENLAAMGAAGSEVLMVGNNAFEDVSFDRLGADTYLVTDWLLNPNQRDISKLRHGTFHEFLQWAKELPICENPVTSVDEGLIDPQTTEEVLVINERAAKQA